MGIRNLKPFNQPMPVGVRLPGIIGRTKIL